jgi:hypothetical protein
MEDHVPYLARLREVVAALGQVNTHATERHDAS